MKIRIKPYDMLFFRDPKPFNKGEDTRADSMVLPNLTTIYGALRTCYFADHPGKLDLANEKDDPTRNLKINQVCYLYDGNEVVYPAPRDLVIEKNMSRAEKNEMERSKKYKTIKLKCKDFKDIESSLKKYNNIEYFYTSETEVEELPMGLISKDELLYYSCNYEEIYLRSLKDMFMSEEKIGIAREDSKHSAKDNLMYRISQVKYEELEIVVNFDGLDIPEEGYLRLGGQGNAVHYKPLNLELTKNEEVNEIVDYVKVYLTVPAIFDNGWLPDFIDPSTLKGEFLGEEVELLSACVGNFISVGGFDMKTSKEKVIYRAVPAGSIYLFKIPNFKLKNAISQVSLGSKLSDLGYGKAFIMKGDLL